VSLLPLLAQGQTERKRLRYKLALVIFKRRDALRVGEWSLAKWGVQLTAGRAHRVCLGILALTSSWEASYQPSPNPFLFQAMPHFFLIILH
jgi:hypothetical protein